MQDIHESITNFFFSYILYLQHCVTLLLTVVWRWQSDEGSVDMDLLQQEEIWPTGIIYEHWRGEKWHIWSILAFLFMYKPHFAMININSQDVLDKSALPAAETVIRLGRRGSVTAIGCMENKLGSC